MERYVTLPETFKNLLWRKCGLDYENLHILGFTIFQIQMISFFGGVCGACLVYLIGYISKWHKIIVTAVLAIYAILFLTIAIVLDLHLDNLDLRYTKGIVGEMIFPGLISGGLPLYFVCNKLVFNEFLFRKYSNKVQDDN